MIGPNLNANGGFQRDLLYVIAGLDGPKGLAIKEELEAYYEKEIHHGRLYPNLDTLVDKGLVEKGQKDRRTNVYKITGRGDREIEAGKNGNGSISKKRLTRRYQLLVAPQDVSF